MHSILMSSWRRFDALSKRQTICARHSLKILLRTVLPLDVRAVTSLCSHDKALELMFQWKSLNWYSILQLETFAKRWLAHWKLGFCKPFFPFIYCIPFSIINETMLTCYRCLRSLAAKIRNIAYREMNTRDRPGSQLGGIQLEKCNDGIIMVSILSKTSFTGVWYGILII